MMYPDPETGNSHVDTRKEALEITTYESILE